MTVLAAQAAGLEQLYPDAGAPWHPRPLYLATHPHSALPLPRHVIGARRTVYSVPDDEVTATVDVAARLAQKVAAVLAHRTEVERGALPGLIAGLSPDARKKLLSTEWYIRYGQGPPDMAGEPIQRLASSG